MLQRLLVPILLAGALAAPAAADDGSRYSEWRPDGAEAEGAAALETLARELEALIDEAENARAADPRFLQDLRDKIAAHVADAEPREALIRDDFSDGDYTDDPRWEVVSGDFSVDRRLGLRTTIPLSGANTETLRLSLDTILDTKEELLDDAGELFDKGKDTFGDLLSGKKKLSDLRREEAAAAAARRRRRTQGRPALSLRRSSWRRNFPTPLPSNWRSCRAWRTRTRNSRSTCFRAEPVPRAIASPTCPATIPDYCSRASAGAARR